MELVDRLLAILAGSNPDRASQHLRAAGHSEDAWNFARSAGYTESTGLGQDRLTEKGRVRATKLQ